MTTGWFAVLVTLSVLHDCAGQEDDNTTRHLVNSLLAKQTVYIRPGIQTDSPVDVTVTLDLVDISEVNEKYGYIDVYVWLIVNWSDPRLSWRAEHHHNIRDVLLPADQIWQPGIQLINRLDASRITTDGINVVVTHDGHVWLTMPVSLKPRCLFDLYYFPYDIQTCQLKFSPWDYTSLQVNLTTPTVLAVSQNAGPNHYEWSLEDIKVTTNMSSFVESQDLYQEAVYSVVLARRGHFRFYAYLEPAILLSGLVILIFLLPMDDEHRYVLGIGLLVSITFSISGYDWMFTGTGGLSLLGHYYISIHILLAMALFVSTLVTNMTDRGRRGLPPPEMLKLIFIQGLGKVLLIPKVVYSDHSMESKGTGSPCNTEASNTASKICELCTANPTVSEIDGKTLKTQLSKCARREVNSVNKSKRLEKHQSCFHYENSRCNEACGSNTSADRAANEWYQIALSLDRVALVTCVIVLLVLLMAFAVGAHMQ